jgi:hypothetical protein
MILEDLFTFPVVMVDGENEERKEKEAHLLNREENEGYDIVYGEAEYPYYDFVGIEDRWLPDQESLEKALNGKFDACIVKFTNVPQLLVPWPKDKFKKELKKFSENRQKMAQSMSLDGNNPQISVMRLSPKQAAEFLGDIEGRLLGMKDEENKDEGDSE